MLTTARTRIVKASAEFLRAFVDGEPDRAAALAGAPLAEDWPGNTEASVGLAIHLATIERDPDEQPWRVHLVIHAERVVGSINLKGPPDARGDVEIGWGLVATAQRKGLATEAAAAVMRWCFADPRVRRVIATIAPDHERSQAVASRLGMSPVPELRRDLQVWARARQI